MDALLSRTIRSAVGLLLLVPWCTFGQARTQARLILDQDAVKPGQVATIGVELRMPAGWHTYWRNPSEIGGPGTRTKIEWTLPSGITAGEIAWPVPEKHTDPAGDTHVFDGTVLLLVPLTVGPGVATGPLELKARVSWLECETECVPGKTNLVIPLVIGDQTRASGDAQLIVTGRQRLPVVGTNPGATVSWEAEAVGEQRALLFEWATDAKSVDFFPYESKTVEMGAKSESLPVRGGKVRLRKTVTRTDAGWPMSVSGVLVARSAAGDTKAYEVTLPVSDAMVAATAAATIASLTGSVTS